MLRRRLLALYSAPLRRPRPASSSTEVFALVVLGAPVAATGGLTPVLQWRVAEAARLWRRDAPRWIVVTGGVTRAGAPSEASVMAQGLRALGVPTSVILEEPLATSTQANAMRTAALLATRQVVAVRLVTHPFHLRRAHAWFRQAGLRPLVQPGRVALTTAEYSRRGLMWCTREYVAWGVTVGRLLRLQAQRFRG